MKKFVEFSIHDYMDMYPSTTMHSMEEEQAAAFAESMNANYSGGTTTLKRILTKEEAQESVINTIQDILDRPNVTTTDGSLDSVDVDFIKNLVKEYNICYK